MSAIPDSETHFRKRCNEINLCDATYGKRVAIGVKTLGTAAHVVGTPRQDVSESEIRERLEANTPGLPIGDVTALKRILFELQTLALSSLRQFNLDPDGTSKQKLPEAEKSQRVVAFKAANPGLFLESRNTASLS